MNSLQLDEPDHLFIIFIIGTDVQGVTYLRVIKKKIRRIMSIIKKNAREKRRERRKLLFNVK